MLALLKNKNKHEQKARGGSKVRSTKIKSKKQSEDKRLVIDEEKGNNKEKLTSDKQDLKSKAKESKEMKNKDKRLNNQSTNKVIQMKDRKKD